MGRIALATCLMGAIVAASAASPEVTTPKPPTASSATIAVPKLSFSSRKLANGLEVYTLPDSTTANVGVAVFYKVGSKDDPRGRSGFAHLFEHLMFKATRNVPTGGLGKFVTDVGGSYNASTYYDYTNYDIVVPASHLEAVLWMEAERMSHLVVDEASFRSERDVVKEELRQRIFAQPYGRIFYLLLSQYTYTAHPYARPMGGTIADLDAATLADVHAFHQAFYRPDNAVLIISGNFDEQQARQWTDRYFGALSRPGQPIPRNEKREPERQQPRAVTAFAPNVPLPAVIQTYQAPRAADPDTAAMVLLEAVLAKGPSSRLYRSLVYDKRLASTIKLWNLLAEDGGVFAPVITLAKGQSAADAAAALSAEIKRLRDEPVAAAELQKAKNALLAAELESRETADGRGFLLGNAIMETGDATWADRHISAIQALTAADVQRVARRYLADHRRVSIQYLDDSQRTPGQVDDLPLVPLASLGSVVSPATRKPEALLPESERRRLPAPGAPRSVARAALSERTLSNGLRVVVSESTTVPLANATLVVGGGSAADPADRAGLATIIAGLITRGTATRSAEQIASEIESAGATLSAAVRGDGTVITLSAPASTIEVAGAVLSDVVMHPALASEELARERQEALDELAVDMQQPGKIAQRIFNRLMFGAAPYGSVSTDSSISAIARNDVVRQYQTWWRPDAATLIITGSLAPQEGFALAERLFAAWQRPSQPLPAWSERGTPTAARRTVVVDFPGAGQAAVFALLPATKRKTADYNAMTVGASVLGGAGGRLYEEIRVKRGLSYGAGSQLDARRDSGVLLSAAQTKNESAPQVVELMLTEIDRLAQEPINAELVQGRVTTLIGQFNEQITTAAGLASHLAGLALQEMPLTEVSRYEANLAAVTPARVQTALRRVGFRSERTTILIVGSAAYFIDELRKRHPNVEVIPLRELDPSLSTLRKIKQ